MAEKILHCGERRKTQEARGGTNCAFGKPCFCSVPKRGRFDENGENDKFAFCSVQKTRASLLRPLKTTKMTKMVGVTEAKAWFRKGRVCSSLGPQTFAAKPQEAANWGQSTKASPHKAQHYSGLPEHVLPPHSSHCSGGLLPQYFAEAYSPPCHILGTNASSSSVGRSEVMQHSSSPRSNCSVSNLWEQKGT